MSPSEEFVVLQAAFDRLVDLPDDARETALRRVDGLSAENRELLRQMLAVQGSMDGMTARPAFAALRGGEQGQDMSGRRVGAFVLERELGRGGMGRVFLARRVDESVEQRVAIKLIRAEQLDANTLARFRLERQVLALLKHPHIATLLDAGELADGTPYVAMEYVDGQPLAEFARAIDLRARLRLFLEICDAVSCAHRNMVVHRDLKSSNILIDAAGKSKLLDFGIAKPLLPRLGAHEVHQTHEAQRFFSPHNVAPEQFRGDAITVACDVYGLGVLLYELLAQAPLFDLVGKDPDAIRRLILETEPAPPSSRGPGLHKLRGDLDAIVLRALRKAPSARYASVDSFADDVRNYLDGRPVAARKGRAWYRARKFAARNRWALGTAAVFVSMLGIGAVMLGLENIETARQRDHAQRATQFLADAFRAADPEKALGENLTAKQILEQAQRSIDSQLANDPQLQADLLKIVGEVHLHAKAYAKAKAAADDGLEALQRSGSKDIAARLGLMNVAVRAQLALADYDAAAKAINQALALPASDAQATEIRISRINLELARGDYAAAKTEIDRLLVQLQPLPDSDPRKNAALAAIAATGPATGDIDRGIEIFERVLSLASAQTLSIADTLAAKQGLSRLYVMRGKFQAALALLEPLDADVKRLYGDDSIAYADLSNSVGNALSSLDRSPEALNKFRTAAAIYTKAFDGRHPMIAKISFNLANAESNLHQYAQANADFERAISIARQVWPTSNTNVAMFSTAYGLSLNEQHRFADALPQFAFAIGNDPTSDDEIVAFAKLGQSIAKFALDPSKANRDYFGQRVGTALHANPEMKAAGDTQLAIAKSLGLSWVDSPRKGDSATP